MGIPHASLRRFHKFSSKNIDSGRRGAKRKKDGLPAAKESQQQDDYIGSTTCVRQHDKFRCAPDTLRRSGRVRARHSAQGHQSPDSHIAMIQAAVVVLRWLRPGGVARLSQL